MKYNFIATDFDGTLVDHSLKTTEENYKAIHRFIDAGGKFVISSGRSHMALQQFETELGLISKGNYGISYNGAKIHKTDTRELIYSKNLENEYAQEIMDILIELEIPIVAYSADDRLLIQDIKSEGSLLYLESSVIDYEEVKDMKSIKDDFTKIVIVEHRPKLELVYERVAKINKGRFNMFYTAEVLLEFTNIDASKGKALEFLTDYIGVDINKTIACGDNDNDVSMVKAAGLGVAIKNAADVVKENADYITENSVSDSGIAEVINKFIFNE